MNHVMVDLETLSTKHNAMIVSIGAVKMDFERLTLMDEFYQPVSLQNQPGVMDTDTVTWWLQQGEEARKVFVDPRQVALSVALAKFSHFCYPGIDALWGNRAGFDNTLLRSAYLDCAMAPPWSYKQDRCYRTMCQMFPQDSGNVAGLHNALEDARRQGLNLLAIIKRLREAGVGV